MGVFFSPLLSSLLTHVTCIYSVHDPHVSQYFFFAFSLPFVSFVIPGTACPVPTFRTLYRHVGESDPVILPTTPLTTKKKKKKMVFSNTSRAEAWNAKLFLNVSAKITVVDYKVS